MQGRIAAYVAIGVTDAVLEYAADSVKEFYQYVYTFFLNKAGLELDASAPFSDASICGAIEKKTGIALRTIKDKESIKKDVERWALATLEERTGLRIRDIRNREKLIADVAKFATPHVAEFTGLPLHDLSDADVIKSDVLDYLRMQAFGYLASDIERAKQAVQEVLQETGASLEQFAQRAMIAAGVNPETGRAQLIVDAETVALGLIAHGIIALDNKWKTDDTQVMRRVRRKTQMRAALARFREKHGHRMTYERI
jgi:hypothetical protein